jgi:hypothetical protein
MVSSPISAESPFPRAERGLGVLIIISCNF